MLIIILFSPFPHLLVVTHSQTYIHIYIHIYIQISSTAYHPLPTHSTSNLITNHNPCCYTHLNLSYFVGTIRPVTPPPLINLKPEKPKKLKTEKGKSGGPSSSGVGQTIGGNGQSTSSNGQSIGSNGQSTLKSKDDNNTTMTKTVTLPSIRASKEGKDKGSDKDKGKDKGLDKGVEGSGLGQVSTVAVKHGIDQKDKGQEQDKDKSQDQGQDNDEGQDKSLNMVEGQGKGQDEGQDKSQVLDQGLDQGQDNGSNKSLGQGEDNKSQSQGQDKDKGQGQDEDKILFQEKDTDKSQVQGQGKGLNKGQANNKVAIPTGASAGGRYYEDPSLPPWVGESQRTPVFYPLLAAYDLSARRSYTPSSTHTHTHRPYTYPYTHIHRTYKTHTFSHTSSYCTPVFYPLLAAYDLSARRSYPHTSTLIHIHIHTHTFIHESSYTQVYPHTPY